MNRLNELVADALRGLEFQGSAGPQGDELALTARLAGLALAQTLLRLQVLRRWLALTRREQQVAILVRDGLSNRQIAAQLGISTGTVKTLTWRAEHKLQVASRRELRQMMLAIDWEDELLQAHTTPPHDSG